MERNILGKFSSTDILKISLGLVGKKRRNKTPTVFEIRLKHCIVHPDPDKYPEMARLKDIVLKVVTSAEKKIPTNYPPFTNGWLRSMSSEEKIESLKLTSIPSREHLKRGVKRKSFVPMSTF